MRTTSQPWVAAVVWVGVIERWRILIVVVVAAALAVGALAGTAVAATVSVRGGDPGLATETATATVSGTGEDADDITATWIGGTLDVVDATAAMEAGEGCVVVDAHAARCSKVTAVEVFGGAGNDRLVMGAGMPVTAGVAMGGGDGDDVLLGGPGNDGLDGGPGADVVSSGGGRDEVTVDVGAAGLERDSVDLGHSGGIMRVVTQVAGATLDLAAGTLRLRDATIPVLGARDATLGPAVGTLLGDDGHNRLKGAGVVDGRGGDDELSGMVGPDRLQGGAGDDRIDAGPGDLALGDAGDDSLSAMPGTPPEREGPPVFACGHGDDVAVPTAATLVPLDCEQTLVSPTVFGRPRRVRGGVAVRASFPAGRCGVAAWVRSASGRALSPRLQRRVSKTATSATLRLPLAASVRTLRIAVYFSRPCPAGKRWTVGIPGTALLALPRR
ncbi:MAG: Alkaline phosphatase [Conexibacter sp.]|jgi:hypothetical protein|nr:Alkaline phosphatase [Conexibacter sp.]MCZ4491990.1 Alkaline phosphatase [Conexibacter sp.]